MADDNPLVSDRDVSFLLHDVHRVERLCAFPDFSEHGLETFDLFLQAARQLAREVLRAFPDEGTKLMDAGPAH
jgi:hypothetical protein